jgi:TRAP-type C4-dicarboxylate transport system permease small subunit
MVNDGRAPGALSVLSRRVNSLCEALLFLTLTLMTVVTILQIICRLWFKALTWSEEVTCFLLVFASFLGMTVAFRRGANIAMSFLLDAMPKGAKRAVLIAIELVGIAFFGVVAWYGILLCVHEWKQVASSIPVSMSFMYAIFPVTGAIVILHLASRVEDLVRRGGAEA